MQIPALSTNVQTVLGNNASSADGSARNVAEEAQGAQADKLQATGKTSSSEAVQPVEDSVNEVAASEDVVAASTKVVTTADEVLGTTLGLNVDTTA